MKINVKPSKEYLVFMDFVTPLILKNDYTHDPSWKIDWVMSLFEFNDVTLIGALQQCGLTKFEIIKAFDIKNKRKSMQS